ncbi:fused MFS/spermidine synthase [Archangium violaceum]|uniref:fused MFS/spermidine synthase n=1 Tax=Archangium violaceum TaxID=83451 RepID=UPI00193BA10A|nr:fused MFS/spermidine synthase [Archangium violaceum]QRK09791.1 fused MFS/spermidine synthase [Archangium violaceum]
MLRYALTLFLSAFLLFGVQPLAGKYALPWFGGTPSVWTTCMLFFQLMLLGGYAYSYVSVRRWSPRRQARVHLGLLGLTVAVLAGRALLTGSPVAPGPEWRPAADGISTARLLAMLAVSLGLPFFTLSTTAPLLQSWFSRVRPGTSPYRLYALSNAGSLLALLAYPFLVEPWLGRGVQAWAWAAGFLLFAGGCAACAWEVLRRGEARVPGDEAVTDGGPSPGVGRVLAWLGLSGGASVLLLATTNQLSQDVAAGPFIWMLPLALYLLTFILAFEREALYSRPLTALLLLLAVGGVTSTAFARAHVSLPVQVLVHSGALFSGALLCHGELYRLRPAPRHLGAFYLWVSAGGVLGAAFVHLAAPFLFRSYLEYPLTLGACCLLAALVLLRRAPEESRARLILRQASALLLLLMAGGLGLAVKDGQDSRESLRGFFGVMRVVETGREDPDAHMFTLFHGNVLHGFQYARPERRRRPTSYYTPESGLGLALTEQRRLKQAQGLPPSLRVGVLGLGVGTMAALGRAGDTFRFYEINPQVIALARGEGGYFSFLRDTPARVEVARGDARILLEQELAHGAAQGFDVLAVDVFSSDSIPVHLFTEEVVDVYREHLGPRGVLAMHISNAHLDLLPVALAHARASGLHATLVEKGSSEDARATSWLLLSREPRFSWGETFRREDRQVHRLTLEGPPRVRWTDEHNSMLPLVAAFGVDHHDIVEESAVAPPAVAVPSGP